MKESIYDRSLGRRRSGQRGASIVLFTFLIFLVVLPLIGFGIDGAIMMWERARLSAAIDAAALAAGRGLSIGQDLASQEDSARRTAIAYFNTNFQPGHMGSSVVGGAPAVTFSQTDLHVRKVFISATALIPLTFSRVFGKSMGSVAASGESSRRDVNVVMVLDRSGSQAAVCGVMKASAQKFLDYFVNGRDDLGLISFSYNASLDFKPSIYFGQPGAPTNVSLKDAIGQIACAGNTNMSMALGMAYEQLKATQRPGALSVVLFYTDGLPNSFEAIFPNKTLSDYRYTATNPYQQDIVPADVDCTAPLRGTIIGNDGSSVSGQTDGVYDSTVPNTPPLLAAPGCDFAEKRSSKYFRNSVAFIPGVDAYGSSSYGYKPATGTLDYFPASNTAYGGNGLTIRPDSPRNIVNVAYNTADNAAQTIRNDAAYKPLIYTIGYSSGVDAVLMKRLVNDPSSASYDRSKASGRYIYAPTADQLNAAFQQIAAQIISLSQ